MTSATLSHQATALSDDTVRLQVLDAIKGFGGRPFTIPDLVAKTGLAPYQAESELNKVVRDYRSDLDVDEVGNLVYRFDAGLAAREDIVKADAARRRKAAFKNGLIAFFKAWTVAMVIVYFVLYVILLIAFLVALSKARGDSSSDNRRRSSGWGSSGGSWWFTWGSPFGCGGYGTHSNRRWRNQWNRDTEKQLREGQDPYRMDKLEELKKPSLAERTWYHLFGTAGIKRNPLEQEKELITYIRAKKGFISNADIVALLGVSYEQADSIGTRLVATYEGEMDLTDDGVAIYRFPNLMLTGAPEVAQQVAQLGYLWHVRKKEDALRKHPSRVIPILNVVNIVLAFVTWFAIMPFFGWTGLGAHIGLVFFPLTFSAIFLFLGIRRKVGELAAASSYEQDSMRIAAYQLLFTRRTALRLPGDERALASIGLGAFDASKLRAALPAIAQSVRGELAESGGRLELRAPRVWAEIQTVEKLRAQARSNTSVGRTVFSTRDLPGASPIGEVGPAPSGKGTADAALADEIAKLEKELQG